MNRYLTIWKLLLAFGLLLISQQTQAVSKWVDADGNVNYSDTPPANANAQPLAHSSDTKDTVKATNIAPKSVAEQEAELKKAKQKKDEAAQIDAQKAAEAETKNKNCASARESLRSLESGMRITTVDANGERAFLDDDAKQQRISEARRSVEQNCN